MSKVNTLYSYFQKTPAREKCSNSVDGLCKIDDNANIQSPSDVNRAVSSKCPKSKRSSTKLSKKSSSISDRPAHIGKMAVGRIWQIAQLTKCAARLIKCAHLTNLHTCAAFRRSKVKGLIRVRHRVTVLVGVRVRVGVSVSVRVRVMVWGFDQMRICQTRCAFGQMHRLTKCILQPQSNIQFITHKKTSRSAPTCHSNNQVT